MIINLTPHAINFAVDGETVTINPSGTVARVSAETITSGTINGIPVTESVYGEVQDLPDPSPDTVYVVSSLVAARCKDRQDVFIPAEPIRDDQGRIVGCRSLGRVK